MDYLLSEQCDAAQIAFVHVSGRTAVGKMHGQKLQFLITEIEILKLIPNQHSNYWQNFALLPTPAV